MNWKGIVIAIIVVVLLGFLVTSKSKVKDVRSELMSKLGRFVEMLEKQKFVESVSANHTVELEVNEDFINGKELVLEGSYVDGEFSVGMLEIDGRRVEVRQPKIRLKLEDFSGSVKVSEEGMYTFDGSALYMEAGDLSFVGNENSTIKIKVQCMPFHYTMDGVHADFELEGLNGMLSVDDGKVKVELSNDSLTLKGFVGVIEFGDEKKVIRGKVSSVEVHGSVELSLS